VKFDPRRDAVHPIWCRANGLGQIRTNQLPGPACPGGERLRGLVRNVCQCHLNHSKRKCGRFRTSHIKHHDYKTRRAGQRLARQNPTPRCKVFLVEGASQGRVRTFELVLRNSCGQKQAPDSWRARQSRRKVAVAGEGSRVTGTVRIFRGGQILVWFPWPVFGWPLYSQAKPNIPVRVACS